MPSLPPQYTDWCPVTSSLRVAVCGATDGSGALAVAPHPSALAVATTAGRVFAVSDHTASVGGTVAVGLAPGALGEDERACTVLVANAYDDSVSMVDAGSGCIVRTVSLELPPRAIAVDQRRGRVLVLTSEEFVPSAPAGQVAVLEGRTGRLLHTTVVGADASALALDERTGNAFVTAMNV